MTLNEAIREAKRGGNEALMVDESWSSSTAYGLVSHHSPGLVSSALLRDLGELLPPGKTLAQSAMDVVHQAAMDAVQKYARGSSDDAERKQSMRETAFDESYRNHESVSVVQHPSAPVYVIRDPEDDAEVHLPAEGLPKFVRELAALMTEEQRRALIEESVRQFSDMCLITHVMPDTMVTASPRHINPDPPTYLKAIGGPGPFDQLPPFERAVCEHSGRSYEAIYRESGPGISALPVKSEALSFTLEDLLCEDA